MAENVVLGVQLTGAEAAIAQLTQIDALLKSVKSNHNVKINVNARSLTNAATNAEKLSTSLEKVGTTSGKLGTTGAKSIDTVGKSIKGASRNAESFNTGLGNVFVTMLKFRAISTVINGIGSAFKFALTELKDVDTELVNIRKVTKMSDTEIKNLTKNAYSLATKYGRTASDVLEGATVYARAGYTDQIDQLNELTLLLQNVGDLQADEAAKFILATDKAYKLGGSYENLIKVVDGLDNITNKNATDMQKMTEGMTVAGSVFAESGESIEMYAALLGTVTANTQRSGAEVGRGLRTILMNLRQIRGETEDGELIDGESIAAAAKALKDYAGISTMENGQLRKASDVLAELAGKWDDLNETQRAAVAEAVAGKRQANILMSLMGDWESVQKMMQEYENAAGTAAEENAIYMDSWAAKVEQVKSAWSELVDTIADTEVIKGALDLLLRTIEAADRFIKGPSEEEKKSIMARGTSYDLTDALDLGLTQYESYRNSNYLYESMQQAIDEGREYYDTLVALKRAGEDWTAEESSFVAAYQTLQKGMSEGNSDLEAYSYAMAAYMLAMGHSADQAAEEANTAAAEIAELDGAISDLPDKKTITIEVNTQGNFFTSGAKNYAGALRGAANSILGSVFDGYASGTSNAKAGPALVNENGPEMIAANGLAWIAGGGKPTVTMLPKGATVLTASQTRQATHGKAFSGIPAFAQGTGNTSGYSYTKKCPVCGVSNDVRANICKNCGYNFITGAGVQKAEQVSSFQKTTFDTTYRDQSLPAGYITPEDLLPYDPYQEAAEAVRQAQERGKRDTEYYRKQLGLSGSSGSGSGSGYYGGASGAAAPNFTALEKDLTALLKNLNAQAELAENEEDYLKAMMVYGEAQAAIADLLEQYRANGYADDSDEVLRLANLGYDYAAKQLGGYDKLQQNLIDALNALTDSTDKANELQERREAVDKAREALANAEKQRTVRVFNPVTGQWEWIANAAEITKAQENLKNAEEALKKEEISQTIDAIKNAKPGELGGMNLSSSVLDALFNASPEQQSAFLNALGAATGGADWLGSSAAQTAWNQGTSIGTQYNLAGITLTEEMASGMSIKDLITYLQTLKVM